MIAHLYFTALQTIESFVVVSRKTSYLRNRQTRQNLFVAEVVLLNRTVLRNQQSPPADCL